MYTLYSFTPDVDHDPSQATRPFPRVMVTLDNFPVTTGALMLLTRFEGADMTEQLPDHIVATLGPISNRLVSHMRARLDTDPSNPLKRVTRVISESSVRGPHMLFVPTRNRSDPPKLWRRTYTEDDPTRATPEVLAATQKLLEIPDELKEELDQILRNVYWFPKTADGR